MKWKICLVSFNSTSIVRYGFQKRHTRTEWIGAFCRVGYIYIYNIAVVMSGRSTSHVLFRLALLYRSTVDLVQQLCKILPVFVAYRMPYLLLVDILFRVRNLKDRILDSIYEIQPNLIPPNYVSRSSGWSPRDPPLCTNLCHAPGMVEFSFVIRKTVNDGFDPLWYCVRTV